MVVNLNETINELKRKLFSTSSEKTKGAAGKDQPSGEDTETGRQKETTTVAMVMYQKVFLDLPFYRQSKDWKEKAVPLPQETAANWFNTCAFRYLKPAPGRKRSRFL